MSSPIPNKTQILLEAVAVTREGSEGLYLEWILEGGISAMEFGGITLLVAPEAPDLCAEDGGAWVLPATEPGDHAEIERLRNCLRTEVEAGDSWKREVQELRVQLAERDALLREAACHATRMEPMSASCLNRIDAVLDASSASAEPLCHDCNGTLRVQEPGNPEGNCARCTSAEPSEPAPDPNEVPNNGPHPQIDAEKWDAMRAQEVKS